VPSTQIDWNESPCYVITQAKPWAEIALTDSAEASSTPRRAAVSAFGFGGINAHAILEEFADAAASAQATAAGGGSEAKSALKPKRPMVSLSLTYPEISGSTLSGLDLRLDVDAPPIQAPVRESRTTAARQYAAATPPPVNQAQVHAGRSRLESAPNAGMNSAPNSGTNPAPNSGMNPALTNSAVRANSYAQQEPTSLTDQQAVLSAYIQALNVFQKNALSVHERVMMTYLQDDENA
jgi:hypothetical protein